MDDRARTRGDGLLASDGTVASAPASPGRASEPGPAAWSAPRTDPWRDLRGDHDLDRRARRGRSRQRRPGRPGRGRHRPGRRAAGDARPSASGRDATSAAQSARATPVRGLGRRPGGATTPAGTATSTGSSRCRPAPRRSSDQYLASALVLAAAEDKLNRGALVASPSAPWVWGDEIEDLSSPSGAYHLVWSRDAYQFGTALWAMGDQAAARRIVDWLFGVQQKPDGSFPQNSDVQRHARLERAPARRGRAARSCWPGWSARTTTDDLARASARPPSSSLAFRDEETGRRAPYSPQERWENQSGYSPNSIAAQISGLVVAADMARERGTHGARARSGSTRPTAGSARSRTGRSRPTGRCRASPYFLRLTKNGDPDTASPYADGRRRPGVGRPARGRRPELPRPGALRDHRARRPGRASTLPVIDEELGFTTPNGPFWHRFSHDGYGETRDGGQWEITDPGDLRDARPRLAAAHRRAGRVRRHRRRGRGAVPRERWPPPPVASDMISEQVWDGRPPTGEPCCPAGEGTRAATPLVWSHAGLVRLAWTIQRGAPVDQQDVVADRYARRAAPLAAPADYASSGPKTVAQSRAMLTTVQPSRCADVDDRLGSRVRLPGARVGELAVRVVVVDEHGQGRAVRRPGPVQHLLVAGRCCRRRRPAGDRAGPGCATPWRGPRWARRAAGWSGSGWGRPTPLA